MTSTTNTALALAELSGHAAYIAGRLTDLAAQAAEVPHAAQATQALLQAATAAEVARAYLDTAAQDAQPTQDTAHHHPEPCGVCGASLPFAPAEGALARCALCQGLAEPTGLSIEATRRLEADRRHLAEHLAHLGQEHAQAMDQAWKDIR